MKDIAEVALPSKARPLDMEIDLYTDLAAFNALTPEEQEEEAERLRMALEPPEPPPEPLSLELPAAPAPQQRPPATTEPTPMLLAAPQGPAAPPVARPPMPAPRPPMARVMLAPAAVFAGQMMADTPGSVILRAEDILPEEDELEIEPAPELKAEPIPELVPEPAPEPVPEPQPVSKPPESIGRKVKMDDQLKVSGPLVDLGIPATKPNSGLIICPVCNSSSNPQDLFCIGCGSFLTEPEEPDVELIESLACADCGAAVEPGEIFCPSCGSSLPG